MTSALAITTEAKTWVGTPYVHLGRHKEVGVDCIGLILEVLKKTGYSHSYEDTPYRRMPGARLITDLESHCDLVWRGDASSDNPLTNVQEADIAVIAWGRTPVHSAFLTFNTTLECWYMIHSHSDPNAVVHHRVDEWWRHRIKSVFRLKGLEA